MFYLIARAINTWYRLNNKERINIYFDTVLVIPKILIDVYCHILFLKIFKFIIRKKQAVFLKIWVYFIFTLSSLHVLTDVFFQINLYLINDELADLNRFMN